MLVIKKIISLCLVIACVCSFAVTAFAAKPNRVFAEDVDAVGKSSISVPVKIENNSGIMGFKIIITFDSSALTPVSVSKSKMLKGMLNDSIGTSQVGKISVVWAGTENLTSDGELFVVNFAVNAAATGNKTIGLSYSEKDTFNESWEDVALNCESFNVKFSDKDEPTTEPIVPGDTEQQTEYESYLQWVKSQNFFLKVLLYVFVVPFKFIASLFGR